MAEDSSLQPVYKFKRQGRIGRPTLLSNEIIELIGENIRLGMTYTDAVQTLGISRPTFYDWMREAMLSMDAVNASPDIQLTEYQRLCIDFYWSVQKGLAGRKETMLRRIDEASKGEKRYVEKKTTYRDNGAGELAVYEVIEQEKVQAPQWQAAAWMLERLHPSEFGRKDRVTVVDWRQEVKSLIKAGSLSFEDVEAELGPEIASELFEGIERVEGIASSSLTLDNDNDDEQEDG